MKILQTSLALIALFALMTPCVHAEEHCHDEVALAELCATDHAECHTCSDEPCADTSVAASIVPVSEIPVRQIQLITIFETTRPMFVAAFRPAGELQLLQTVQLLI